MLVGLVRRRSRPGAVTGRLDRLDELVDGDRPFAERTVACSVAKLTVASTPSSSFSVFSTRAAQEAQVIPSRSSRTSALCSLPGMATHVYHPGVSD